MKESDLWRQMRDALPQIHWTRIEAWNRTGLADVNGCYRGIEFWVELKIGKGVGKVEFQHYQIPWLQKRYAAGGRVFVGVRHTNYFYLYPGSQAKELAEKGIFLHTDWEWALPFSWDGIFEVLVNAELPR